MPAIPQHDGPVLIGQRGTNLQHASGLAFGSQVGQAVEGLGSELNRTAQQQAVVQNNRQTLEADKWVNESMRQLRDYYSEWTANPENHGKETFADDFREMAEKSAKEHMDKAPSNRARQMFQEQFGRFSSARFEAASITSAKTKANNLILSHENQNHSVVKGYETDRSVPDLDANGELITNIHERFNGIDATIGRISPQEAVALKNQLVEDSVYATMNYSPDTARKILGMGTLDGRRKHSLESQIDAAQNSRDAVDGVALDALVQNRIDLAELGRMPQKFSVSDLRLYLPDDKAQALATKVNAQIDIHNTVHEHLNRIRSWSGPEQSRHVKELASKAGLNAETATKDKHVLRLVSAQVADNIAAYKKDPAGYLIENNPSVKAIDDHIKSLAEIDPKNPAIPQKFAERDALMLKFQSVPGPEVTGDVRRQYSAVNRAQLKVMSDTEAKAAVRRINESSPNEALNTIMAEIGQHPGHESIAFNNLIQLQEGEGLRGDYWLLYKNALNPAAADLAGAIQNSKAVKELATDKIQDFEDELNAYDPWKAFLRTFPSDNYQMEGMAAGMKSGIMSYAMARSQTERFSPKVAVRESVDKWIYGEMGPASINGYPVMFDRDQKGKRLSDTDIEEMGHNLSLATRIIDPKKVDTKDEMGREHFPILKMIGNDATREEQLRQLITTRGFFKPSADGSVATLYMRSDDGTPFEMRDKQGNAFGVRLDQLGDLRRYLHTFTGKLDVTHMTDPLKPTVSVTYEARQYEGGIFSDTYYAPVMKTNWPVDPKWFIKVERKKK